MTCNQTVDQILATIGHYSNVTHDDILAADSIDHVLSPMAVIEVIFDLEEKYGMEIDDHDVLAIESVDDLVACVLRHLDIAA